MNNTLYIGDGNNNLPILLHLEDPRSGNVLVSGCRKKQYLKYLIENSSIYADENTLGFVIFTDNKEHWRNLHSRQVIGGICSPNESHFLQKMEAMALRRKNVQNIVFFIDDLDLIVRKLKGSEVDSLKKILEYGPPSRIRTVATSEQFFESLFGVSINVDNYSQWIFNKKNNLWDEFYLPKNKEIESEVE